MAEIAASSTDLVTTSRQLPVTVRGGGGSVLARLAGFTRDPAVARSLPMIGLIALLGFAALAWLSLREAPQRDLFAGMGDSDKEAAAGALGTAGIPYAIDRSSGALSVGEDDFYKAKMLLASQGLPKGAPDGEAMIASLPMGASRAVEGERLRGAREMDLARTIEAIDAVESAKVHLAVAQPSAFLRDEAQAQASVMLRLRSGRSLNDNQVQAIVHLVASSVPGLSPDAVSVVDQAGRLLSQPGGDPEAQATDRQVGVQTRVEDRYRRSLAALLTPIVGEGNFTAEVHADLDFAETQATRESFPKDDVAVRAEQGTRTNDDAGDDIAGGNPTAVGIPGALSNEAPPASKIVATQNAPAKPAAPPTPGQPTAPDKINETYNRSFDVGREVSVTKNPVGTVKRLSVAVALRDIPGKRRTAQEIAAIQDLVKGAIGFDAARGDVVALSSRKFADVADDAPAPFYDASWFDMLVRNVTALLVAALIVFGIARPLLKRRAIAAPAAPASTKVRAKIGGEIANALADQSGDPTGRVTLDMIEAAPGYTARAALIRNFVRQDPDRAALVVRDLIRSDMPLEGAR